VSELQELMAGRFNDLSRRVDALTEGYSLLLGIIEHRHVHLTGRLDDVAADVLTLGQLVLELGSGPVPGGDGEPLAIAVTKEIADDGEGRVAEESEGFGEEAAA
jgi:hypothetical protein